MNMFSRNKLALYCVSLFSYQYMMAPALLGAMYSSFPNLNQSIVTLMYTLPALLSAGVSLLLGVFMNRLNKKRMVIVSCLCIVVSGVIILAGGKGSFAVALLGSCLCGIGFALIASLTNTMLIEDSALGEGSKAVGINSSAGCLGAVFTASVGGFLAKSGDWTRAYLLCFAAVISLVVFLVLYREKEKVAVDAVEETSASQQTPADSKNIGLFVALMSIFICVMIHNAAFNGNYSAYVLDNGLGTVANAGIISSLCSLGGVVGGFFTAIALKMFKNKTVPVCILLVTLPSIAMGFGTKSLYLIYFVSFAFLVFFYPAFSIIMESAGRALPGKGSSIVIGVQGLAQFVGPYVVIYVGKLFGDTLSARFLIALVICVLGAVISVPVMRKVYAKKIL